MCVQGSDDDTSSQQTPRQDRRAFLRNAGLAGAGATALSVMGAMPASAAGDQKPLGPIGRWNPDTASQRFTLAVMPDTQFLYWGSQNSINSAPQQESFRYIINNSGSDDNNIVFMAHLGDLTQDADPTSFQAV